MLEICKCNGVRLKDTTKYRKKYPRALFEQNIKYFWNFIPARYFLAVQLWNLKQNLNSFQNFKESAITVGTNV